MKSRISMQKVTGHISAVIKGTLFIGISVQIVMGIVWMCGNFSHVPQFEESLFYMQVSRTLRCDEYTGILYPLFLWIVRRNHYVAYIMQLAAAYAAARRFLRVFLPAEKWKMVLWGSFAFMTIPVVMQCHVAMLPCSFAASLLLLELSLLAEAVRKEEKRTLKRLAELSLCWLMLALLLPEYFYLGVIPAVLFGFCCHRQWKGHRRMKVYGFLLAVAFAGMILGINSLTQTPGLYGRLQKTPVMTLMQRVVWTSILGDYPYWPQQIFDTIGYGVVQEAAEYADGMERLFFPAMEQAIEDRLLTRQQVKEYYNVIMEKAWIWHGSVILKEMIWDALGYGASPALLQVFLTGRGHDFYGRNYDFFLEYTPRLSKLYMDYGSWWFAVAVALTAVLQLLQLWDGGLLGKKTAARTVLCCLIMAGAMIIWYTMRGAGMQDYKNTAAIVQLWMAWSVLLLRRGEPVKFSLEENMERDA